jgi:ParB family chromosome partitioning protein
MPENTFNSPNMNSNAGGAAKKKGLGRGMGSLLGGGLGGMDTGSAPAHVSILQDEAPAAQHTQVIQAVVPAATAEAAKAPSRPINEESQIWMIPIDRLAPNTQQPRQIFTAEGLRDLTSSIKEKGILQPIVARRMSEREFEIIAGERRWRAAQAAGLHEVPVILKKVTEQDSLELAIIENIQRENLNPMEEAEAFDHLMLTYQLTQQQVAEKLGKERSTVANTLRLLVLPGEVKEMLRKNDLSAGHAKVLLGVENPQTQVAIARQVLNEKLSVRATEKLVAKAKSDARAEGEQKAGPAINVDVSKRLIDGLSSELQKLIGTKITIDYAESKGKLAIHFYSDEQLTQVVEKLRKAWEK